MEVAFFNLRGINACTWCIYSWFRVAPPSCEWSPNISADKSVESFSSDPSRRYRRARANDLRSQLPLWCHKWRQTSYIPPLMASNVIYAFWYAVISHSETRVVTYHGIDIRTMWIIDYFIIDLAGRIYNEWYWCAICTMNETYGPCKRQKLLKRGVIMEWLLMHSYFGCCTLTYHLTRKMLFLDFDHRYLFLPEASFGLRVLSLPVSVSVRVRNHWIFRAITSQPFKLGSPN